MISFSDLQFDFAPTVLRDTMSKLDESYQGKNYFELDLRWAKIVSLAERAKQAAEFYRSGRSTLDDGSTPEFRLVYHIEHHSEGDKCFVSDETETWPKLLFTRSSLKETAETWQLSLISLDD